MWNDIGNKLIAMAQDFPEDKYDFKLQKDQRTFGENLLQVAAVDVTGQNKSSGSERESLCKGAGHADEEIQAGADRNAAAAD